MDAEFTNGIKVAAGDMGAKAISVIRKATGLPMGEIRRRATADEYIMCCDATDDEELARLVKLYRALEKAGVKATVYDNDEPADIQLLLNGLESSREDVRAMGIEESFVDEPWWDTK